MLHTGPRISGSQFFREPKRKPKRKMKNPIVQSNEWYDKLPDGKRTLFFFLCILLPIGFSNYFTVVYESVWFFVVTILLFSFWRIGYIFINWRKEYKK